MKPAPFAYRRPRTLEEAASTCAQTSGAKVLAGGQSLVPLLSMRLAGPPMLVDINGLADLDYVRADQTGVHIGALARHARVLADPETARVQPLLPRALEYVAHPTIRNRGTVVGSVVHADPSAEMPAVLALLGGRVSVVSTSQERTIAAHELFVGPLESSLAAHEVATEVWLPALTPAAGMGFVEVARRNGDYALCGVAALVGPTTADPPGTSPHRTRVSFLGVCDVPTVVDLTDVVGPPPWDQEAYQRAGEQAAAALDPPTDIHGTGEYRSQLARVLTSRALSQAAQHHADRGASTPA